MGESKRKKLASAMLIEKRCDRQLLEKVAPAIRKVVGAMTGAHGADCLIYAAVGARALSLMGVDAKMVAGSAAWRVAPADGAVLMHAIELASGAPALFSPSPRDVDAAVKGALFHAWIEVADEVIDFTTFALRDKARLLDEADGQHTEVLWCPDFLVKPRNEFDTFKKLVEGFTTGACCYVRHESIEKLVFQDICEEDIAYYSQAVVMVAKAISEGARTNVFVTDEHGIRDSGDSQAESLRRGLQKIDIR